MAKIFRTIRYSHILELMEQLRFFLTVLLVCCSLFVNRVELRDIPACKFGAIFNFGDSNSDTGGGSAAFYPAGPPCGETFFHRPAGRGSDGRLIIDFIGDKHHSFFLPVYVNSLGDSSYCFFVAEHFGLPLLSAYLDSIGANFQHGANFASGGATIRPQNESWNANGVSPFSLDIQVAQFNQFKERTSYLYDYAHKDWSRSNLPKPQEFSEALYTFDIGQNDLAAGFWKMNETELLVSMPNIIDQLAVVVQNLYDLGARRFWIHNTGAIGCLSVTTHYHLMPKDLDKQGCVKYNNNFAVEFNRQLKERVINLRTKLPNATLTYVDIYAAKYELIGKAKQLGFVDAAGVCCGYHEYDIHVWCGHKANINGTGMYAGSCEDPSRYTSWDGVHYTEAANHWIANHILDGSFNDPPLPISYACHKPSPN